MLKQTEFSRALFLAVDAWKYGSRDGHQQWELQEALSDAVSAAAAIAGLDRATWQIQAGGDGFLAVVPDGGAEQRLVYRFVEELDDQLARFNCARRPEARLRLRVAIHHGGAIAAAFGYASDGAVHACRLRDAESVRAALTGLPGSNLVLVLSQAIFKGSVQQNLVRSSAEDFVRVQADVVEKGFREEAWVRVPGATADQVAAVVSPAALALCLRLDGTPRDIPGFIDSVVSEAFEKAGISLPTQSAEREGRVGLSLHVDVPVERVLGVWLHYLAEGLAAQAPRTRVAVGVALGDLPTARALADSETAAGVLEAAGTPVVIAVSDEVYRRFVVGSVTRMVRSGDYRQVDIASGGWLRVPGYSVPPEPAVLSQDTATTAPAIPNGAYHGPVSTIGTGTFHGPFVVGTMNSLGWTGR
ncbi:hypothetical protein [Amycolatopsis magusensis]|uniref:Guanylate cyclase domain-containing protein n=1 Tax=Amycolatopsis magusensis TaxID=882444 RepID=A0ABS4PYR4_9PSEU|nr:hypothetical protein [Amycolatopsis magusensis]MBP2184572.1 hypothetical protein [Amycolatopsis magusensis]